MLQKNHIDFWLESIRRDFAQTHRGSLLGRTWVLLQPLAMIVIYTLVFSRVMHSRLPGDAGIYAYSVFLCAGLLPWNFFAEALRRSQGSFIDQAHLLRKSALPLGLPAAIGVGIAAANFALVTGLFLLFLAFIGQWPGWILLAALPVLALQTVLAAGLGIALGVINVFFRDAGQLTTLSLQFGFWFTPIVYPLTVLPDWLQPWVMALNPLVGIVGWYQQLLLHGTLPPITLLAPAAIWCLIAGLLARHLMLRRGAEIVDLL